MQTKSPIVELLLSSSATAGSTDAEQQAGVTSHVHTGLWHLAGDSIRLFQDRHKMTPQGVYAVMYAVCDPGWHAHSTYHRFPFCRGFTIFTWHGGFHARLHASVDASVSTHDTYTTTLITTS